MLVLLLLLGGGHSLGVEGVEVHSGPYRQLLDLTLAQRHPCPLPHLAGGMPKGPGGGLQRRQPPDPMRGMLLQN